mgnify:CR=1 FL=1
MNLNAMTVKFNGTAYTIPSTPVSNANGDTNKIYTFAFDIPAVADAVLEFYAAAADNTLGLRLDNIRIYVDDSNQLEP